jgi:hypothetical protein
VSLKHVRRLHPKNATQLLIELFGTLTLAAPSEETFGAGRSVRTKQQLVFVSSAEGAGFAMKFSAHRSNPTDLFVHGFSAERVGCVRIHSRVGSPCVVVRMPNHTEAEG